MHKIEIPERKIKWFVPEDLSECTSQQYIDMCELLFRLHTGQIDETEFLTHSVYKLLNMVPGKSKETNPVLRKIDEQNKFANIAQIADLLKETFFFKQEQDDGSTRLNIIQNYIHNPVPAFTPLWRTYYGPTEAFQNVKGGEYVEALRAFLQFNKTGDIDWMYELVAILYRPKKPFHFITKLFSNYDGDCRIVYNQHHLQKRIKAFKYAPFGFLYGVYLYFASFQLFVSGAEVPWGDKVLDLSILFKGDSKMPEIEAADIGMDGVLFAFAESGIFGDFDKAQQVPFWTMMIKMYDARVKQLQEQKNQENANNSQTP